MSNKYDRYFCAKCEDLIYSTYQGEFVRCKCGACFVDATDYYIRRGGDVIGLQELIIEQLEEICLEENFLKWLKSENKSHIVGKEREEAFQFFKECENNPNSLSMFAQKAFYFCY